MSAELVDRLKPFPSRLIHTNPSGGGTYVRHGVVKQRLLALYGTYDFQLVEILRGFVDAVAPNPQGKSAKAKAGSPALQNAVVGVVYRLTLRSGDRTTVIEDVGDCEQPHNWPHDGARLKDAISDALKRCAAHDGVGLHLWVGDEAYLYDQLLKETTK